MAQLTAARKHTPHTMHTTHTPQLEPFREADEAAAARRPLLLPPGGDAPLDVYSANALTRTGLGAIVPGRNRPAPRCAADAVCLGVRGRRGSEACINVANYTAASALKLTHKHAPAHKNTHHTPPGAW